MPIRRLLAPVPFLVVAACLALSLLVPAQGRNDDKIEEDLRRASAATEQEPVRLDWRPLEFLAYDRLYAFGTAATDEGVRDRLGFAWGEGVAAIPPGQGETILVFTAKRRVAAWTRVDGEGTDVGCLQGLGFLRRREALLDARRSPVTGRSVLAPARVLSERRQQRRLRRCLETRGLSASAASESGSG